MRSNEQSESVPQKGRWKSASRIVSVIAFTLAFFGSLLTFPQYTPLMLGGWLGMHFLFSLKYQKGYEQRPSYVPLLCILILVFTKLPEPTAALALFVLSIFVLLYQTLRIRTTPHKDSFEDKKEISRTLGPTRISAVCSLLLFLASHWWGANTSRLAKLDPLRPILCLGDSLTDFGYPEELAKLVSVPIEDLGFNGYTTVDGIGLIPEIIEKRPQCVVIELGGHDYKDGKPRSETRQNLIEIIDACEKIGANVVLVEIIHGFISDPYFGMERGISRQYDLQLVHDGMIRQLVFWSPHCPPGSWTEKSNHFSKDGLHPNSAGNKMMAARVSKALTKIYGPKVLSSIDNDPGK